MSFGIPEAIVPGITSLAGFDKAVRGAVLKVASQIALDGDGNDLDELRKAIGESTSLSDHAAREVSRAILSFLSLRERYKSDAELVEDLSEAIRDHEGIDWEPDGISEFLINLFASATGLRLRLKARWLEYDRERTMLDAQIVTDIRPVYDLEEEPREIVGYVVNNTLKIDYIDQNSANNRARVMYFGVDDTDLEKLTYLLERAATKRKHVSEDLAKISKPLLGTRPDE